ncbi:MAG: CpXC domain-containing protein [Eubacterium sp.]|nr:CpXC domain-containing protein [Eubacterium sp.]
MDKLTSFTREELACPKCGKVHLCERYSVINVTEKPELKDRVLQNKLFVFHCEGCGFTAPLTYESVYIDSKKKLVLYLTPEMTDNTRQSIKAWEQEEAGLKRIVTNLNDLKEKILIAENLLDDRIVEFMKIEHLRQLEKEMKDDNLLNILFDYKGTQYYFMVFFEKKGIGRIPVSMDYYRDVEHRFSGKIGRKHNKKFQEIDMKWAGDIMFQRN